MENDYKIVPIPELNNSIFNKKSKSIKITEMLQELLNNESTRGWEFIDIKTISIPIKKSFLKSQQNTTISVIIFKKNTIKKQHNFENKDNNYTDKLPSLGPAIKD